MNGKLKRKRLLIPLALLLSICLRWYIADIFLFTPTLIIVCFCLLIQINDKHIAVVNSKPISYEDLTDDKSKAVYLIFIRLSISISLVFVVDYVILYYEKQPLFQTIGIVGGLYNIYSKVESRLAKLALLFTYYIIHKQHPYQNHEDEDTSNSNGIITVH